MNHRDLAEKLHDFHFGELGEPGRAGVEEHLRGCPDCRSLSETYLTFHHAIEVRRASAAEHPSPDDLVRFALSPEVMDEEARKRVETHVVDCASCSDEVERVREAEAQATPAGRTGARPSASRLGLRGPGGVYALAASLLTVALLYPAFVGLYRHPELRRRVAELDRALADTRHRVVELSSALEDVSTQLDRFSSWSGPVDVVFLSSALRDVGGIATVAVDPSRPHFVLGVEFDVPRRADPADSLRVTLTQDDGSPVTDVEMSAEEAREAIRTAGVVPLLVPTARLVSGEYRLEVLYRIDGAETKLLEFSFEVVQR